MKQHRLALIATAAALALAASAAAGTARAGPLDDGQAAYTQNRIAEARRDYQAVLAEAGATAADKAKAARELGRLDWLVDRDAAAATGHLKAALATGAETCKSAELYVRVLREAGQAAQAAAEGAGLLAGCDDPAEADGLRQQMLAADLDRAAAGPGGRAAALAAASGVWSQISEDGRGDPDASASGLELAVLRQDAPAALAAWKAYFWLTDHNAPQGLADLEAATPGLFAKGLARDAAVADQLALLRLLIRAGFDETAHRFADMAGLAGRAGADPAWARAVAYFHFVDTARAETEAMNRTLAKGGSKGDVDAYRGLIVRLGGALTGKTKPEEIRTALGEFGLYGTVGETGGYPSLHLGHMVEDQRHAVEQFGRKGEVRFIVIDNMVSNGFESWLWDGSAMAGGWAENGATIIQVRPGYTSGPLRAFSQVGDTPARRKALARIAAMAPADLAAARAQPLVYLPSVSARLRLQSIDAIAARARAKADGTGGGPAAFRTAFLADDWTVTVDQSIFIHEGRHILDQAAKAEIGELKDADMEYRAKLSELELGAVPKLSLATIDDDLIGGDTPHGVANARIVKALSDWAGAHPGEVAGYDRTQPALLQIDKLSDAQIRAVARGLDPWAKAGG